MPVGNETIVNCIVFWPREVEGGKEGQGECTREDKEEIEK